MRSFVKENELEEYEQFLMQHPKGNFAQSSLWAKQKPDWNWDAIIVRGDDGKIKGSLAVMTRKVPGFPYTIMYGCRGPVCDLDDEDTLTKLIDGAKQLAAQRRSYILKIDPDVPSSNKDFTQALVRQGFALPTESKNFEAIQPKYVFRLDLTGHDEDSLMQSFHSKTRYNIRLAERRGVQVRIAGKEAIPHFGKLMLETGLRDGFVTRQPEYFAQMLDNLGEHARLYMAYCEDKPIAGTLAIYYGDKVWYLYGASSNKDRNLMPNYLLQWHMMQWALEKKCRIYDFRGVSGDLSEDNPLYGLYKFKKGFNGEFTEFIGEMDYVIKPFAAKIIKNGISVMKSVRQKIYMLKGK